MDKSPASECAKSIAFEQNPPPRLPALSHAVLGYLNLCSEEHYMHTNGMLSKRVWKLWETEIKRKLSTPLVAREWPELRCEFDSFRAFQDFVENAH